MTRRIVIAGAGGFGRGVYGWLKSSGRHLDAKGMPDIVFIDDKAAPTVAPQAAVVSTIRDYVPVPGDEVLCAIGMPKIRRNVVHHLRERGAAFHTFIDDRATIGSRVRIGEGAVICPGVVISADASIGEHVHINFNCSVGHDSALGSFTTLSPSVNVMGEVVVEEGVFFGGSAAVLPRLTIAATTIIGAGAVVVRDVDAGGVTIIGNAARAHPRR